MEPSFPVGTTHCIPQAKLPRKPYNISFIDQVCSVKMAGYWPHSFFASLWTSSPSLNTHKKELGQYPVILTSHLVNNPYILSSVRWKMAIAHQRARAPHLFFSSHCNDLITSSAWEKTYLISIAENWTNKENSRYIVVFSNLLFGNHVKKFGSNFNQDFSFLSKSNLKCLFVSDTMYWL